MALVKRIPRFMYLTEDREKSLLEVMRSMDAVLFEEISGISMTEFETILDRGLFDHDVLDRSVRAFRHAETESLGYLGVAPPAGDVLAGWTCRREAP